MDLLVLNQKYAIFKFNNKSRLPDCIFSYDFYSITGTEDELSVVALQNEGITGFITCNKDWRIIKVIGPLDLSLVGLIAEISGILSKERIPIFTVSTFDTDYFLIKQTDLNKTILTLKENGYTVSYEE